MFDENKTEAQLTPQQVINIARTVVTEDDIRNLARAVLLDAVEGGSPQARQWALNVFFPKDTSAVEDTRFKTIVYCTFEEYGEVQRLQQKVAKLEQRLKEAGLE